MAIFLRHSWDIKPVRWGSDADIMYAIKENCEHNGIPLPVFALPLWEYYGNRATGLGDGYIREGTLINKPNWVVGGLNFERVNSQHVSIGYDFLPTTDITIFFDYRVDAVAASSAAFGVKNENISTKRCSIHAPHSDSNIYWDYGGDVSGTSRLMVAAPSGFLGSRSRMCFTARIGAGMNIYHQGDLLASHSGNVPTRVVGDDFWIGGCYFRDFTIRYHNNDIYNMCIFSKVLSPQQCQCLSDNPNIIYQKVSRPFYLLPSAAPDGNPLWYFNMLKRRNA